MSIVTIDQSYSKLCLWISRGWRVFCFSL